MKSTWLSVLAVLAACHGDSRAACPSAVSASVDTLASQVQYGDSAFVTSTIVAATAACLDVTTSADSATRAARMRIFSLPVTASVRNVIRDPLAFERFTATRDLTSNLVFEAVSANGTRIQSATVPAIINQAPVVRASTAIGPLTIEELRAIHAVRAHWEYGR